MLGLKKNKCILLLLLAFNVHILNAQFYNQGNDPASTKWRYINSGNIKLIFPSQVDSLARRYAAIIENDRLVVNKFHFNKNSPFPVILHPFNIFSNGLVVWAPKRVEFITSPQSFYGYPQPWENQLSLHEQRHIFQMMNFERGFLKPLSWFFGEQAAGLGVGIYSSKWELEGDAVVAETIHSNSGRGRDPEFLLHYKAAFLSGDLRKFQNWSIGTLSDYEPDHYSFGYYFLANLIDKYGQNVYESALDYRLKNPLDINVSNNSYRKITGIRTKKEIFKKLQESSIEKWLLEDSLNKPYSKFILLTKSVKQFENYKSITLLNDTTILAVRESLDNITEVGLIDSLRVFIKLTNAGYINSGIKCFNDKVYWSEGVPSVRWEQLSFSKIVSFNIKTGEKKYLSTKTRFFNPVPIDNDILVAVEYPVNGSSNLVFINEESGKVFKRVKAPGGAQIKEIVVLGDDLFFSMISNSGISFMRYSLINDTIINIKDFGGYNISHLSARNTKVFFNTSFEDKINIYSYNVKNGEFSKLINSRFAAKAPISDSIGNLIYLNYDNIGYHPVKTLFSDISISKVEFPKTESNREELNNTDTISIYNNLQSVKYSKFKNLINVHSWAPVFYDIEELQTQSFAANEIPVKPGFMIMSQDLLSTSNLMMGYSYSNGFNAAHFKFKYTGVFPVFELKTNLNERKALSFYREEQNDQGEIVIKANELIKPNLNTSVQMYIPFNYSRGGRSRYFIPQVSYKYKNDTYLDAQTLKQNKYNQVIVAAQYYDVKNMAKRNIYPGNGFGLYSRFSTIPRTGNFFGQMFYMSGYLYLPGLLPNHGVKLSTIYQKQFVEGKYFYQENVSGFVRGYEDFYADEIGAFKFNYVFPIYFKQNFMLSVLYIKRFQIVPFIDFARYIRGNTSGEIYSFGSDLLADFHLLGIFFPFSGGLRYLHRNDKKSDIQFLINFSL